VALLGPERAVRAARIIEDNVAALGGNVSLGILLGMEPVIATFFGLPLEVRHVTLSTGSWRSRPGRTARKSSRCPPSGGRSWALA
jgi:site-specific recombinase